MDGMNRMTACRAGISRRSFEQRGTACREHGVPGGRSPSFVNSWREEASAPSRHPAHPVCRLVSPIRPFRLFSVQSLYRPRPSLRDSDACSRRQFLSRAVLPLGSSGFFRGSRSNRCTHPCQPSESRSVRRETNATQRPNGVRPGQNNCSDPLQWNDELGL